MNTNKSREELEKEIAELEKELKVVKVEIKRDKRKKHLKEAEEELAYLLV